MNSSLISPVSSVSSICRSRPAAPAWRAGPARAPPLPAARGYRAPAWRSCRPSSCAAAAPACASGSAMRFSAARQVRAPPAAVSSPSGCGLGFQRIEGIAVVAAGADMAVDFRQENFAGPARAAARDPRRPAFAGQRARRLHRIFQRVAAPLRRRRSGPSAVLPSPRMRVRARPSGPADPAAQLRHLAARQQARRSRCRRRRTDDGLRRRHSAAAVPAAYRWSGPSPASRCAACAITSA